MSFSSDVPLCYGVDSLQSSPVRAFVRIDRLGSAVPADPNPDTLVLSVVVFSYPSMPSLDSLQAAYITLNTVAMVLL